MAFVPNSRVMQLSILMSWDNQMVMNTLYVTSGSEVSINNLQEANYHTANFWVSTWSQFMSDTVNLISVKAQKLGAPTDLVDVRVPTGDTFGNLTSPSMPNNVSLAVAFKTNLSGRSNQGRNFWCGLVENQVTSNVVAPSFANGIASAYEEWATTLYSDYSLQHCIYSRYENNVPREEGAITAVTNYIVTDYVVDSMRRRLPSRGR